MGFDVSPVWISVKTVLVATIITFFIGIVAAYWMTNYNGKFRSIVDTVFTLPLVLPPTVVGFLLLLVLGRNGPLGKLLLHIGVNLIFSWPAAVAAATIVAFPLMYRTTKGAFDQMDNNVINAARTLGVSQYKIFLRVILPLAWPGIAEATILSFARALGEFGATLMVAGNIPGRTQTIPLAIYFAAENGEMGKALMWVILIIMISTVVIFFMNYLNGRQKRNVYGVRRG